MVVLSELRDALLGIAGGNRGEVDNKRLGRWLLTREGRVVDGLRLKRRRPDNHNKVVRWSVQVAGRGQA